MAKFIASEIERAIYYALEEIENFLASNGSGLIIQADEPFIPPNGDRFYVRFFFDYDVFQSMDLTVDVTEFKVSDSAKKAIENIVKKAFMNYDIPVRITWDTEPIRVNVGLAAMTVESE